MEEKIFEARNLTKKYRKNNALYNLNMEIHRGDIYGFIGKNGAGKTTLMRILAGMAKQTSGEIELFGENDSKKLYIQRKRIGGMVEKPAIYPGLTAIDNLEIYRLQRGIKEKGCIDEVLQMVDLTYTDKKRVKNFSLGMKQRLGLAMALLGNQEFLFLDEPVNGLDPEGIIEFRELLKKLNRELGITILISSHLLNELHQLATCYGFIHKGKMIEQISVKALNEKCRKYVCIKVDDTQKATSILSKSFNGNKLKIISENLIHLYDFTGNTSSIMKELVLGEVNVDGISATGVSLEEYYMSLIGRGKG